VASDTSRTKAPTILCDSREPSLDAGDHPDALFHPWLIRKRERVALATERVTMREGDYSIRDLALWKPLNDDGPWRGEPLVVLERKSLSDAISTVVGSREDSCGDTAANRDRFADELRRMGAYAFRCIVIEGAPADVQREAERPERRFDAGSVLSSYAIFAARFGVQVWWAGSRAGAEWYVGTVLARIWDEYIGGPACKKARERGDMMPWIGRGVGRAEEVEERARIGDARAAAERAADHESGWAPRVAEAGGMPWSTREAMERRERKRKTA
jgi:hypothetical protein